MILFLAAVLILVCGVVLAYGLAMAMCMVARDADEMMREHAERKRAEQFDPLEEKYALPACEGRVHTRSGVR